MKRNETPQMLASASSIRMWRRLTLVPNAPAAVGLPRYSDLPGFRCGTARPPSSRSHRRRARAHRRAARTRAEPFRAGRLLAALVRALRLQAFGARPEAIALDG